MTLDLQDRRLWIGGGALLALLILAVGWLFAISPKRSEAANLRQQTVSTTTQNAQLQAQDSALVRQSRNLPEYQARLRKAMVALPPYRTASYYTAALAGYAELSGVKLSSIAVSATGASSTADATTTASGAQPADLSITASGPVANEIAFLEAIRTGPRPVLITSTQFAVTGGAKNTVTAQIQIFNSPVSEAELQKLHALLKPAK